jgi:hypothetical protein
MNKISDVRQAFINDVYKPAAVLDHAVAEAKMHMSYAKAKMDLHRMDPAYDRAKPDDLMVSLSHEYNVCMEAFSRALHTRDDEHERLSKLLEYDLAYCFSDWRRGQTIISFIKAMHNAVISHIPGDGDEYYVELEDAHLIDYVDKYIDIMGVR